MCGKDLRCPVLGTNLVPWGGAARLHEHGAVGDVHVEQVHLSVGGLDLAVAPNDDVAVVHVLWIRTYFLSTKVHIVCSHPHLKFDT